MMKRYDPLVTPDPGEWQAIDEQERIDLVVDYHRRARIRLPNLKVHAAIHAVIETQIALGEETPVERTVRRLMSEGLDRHDAIHAAGSVLAEFIYDVRNGRVPDDADPNEVYYAELERQTAEKWRRSG